MLSVTTTRAKVSKVTGSKREDDMSKRAISTGLCRIVRTGLGGHFGCRAGRFKVG